jgi:hypothetical protein
VVRRLAFAPAIKPGRRCFHTGWVETLLSKSQSIVISGGGAIAAKKTRLDGSVCHRFMT